MTSDTWRAIKQTLDAASQEDRKRTFDTLRREFPIHDLEKQWNVQAEVILEAIARAPDFTQRGMRGVIAEASFAQYVVQRLLEKQWRDTTPSGDRPFDFRLADAVSAITIQVKNQRKLRGQPMLWRQLPGLYVAETDKSRKGEKKGETTRAYRFGDFDILAVCMHPSTNDWSKFLYTVGRWLLPRADDPSRIRAHQPVDPQATDEWTSDYGEVISWLRSGINKTLTVPIQPLQSKKAKGNRS